MRVLGRAAVRQSDLEFGKSLAERHLSFSRLNKDPWEEAWALQNLGKIAQAQGRLAEARELQDTALTLFQRLEDKRAMAMTLLNLCVVALIKRTLAAMLSSRPVQQLVATLILNSLGAALANAHNRLPG